MFYYIVLNVVILFAIHYKHDIIVVYNKCNYMKQYWTETKLLMHVVIVTPTSKKTMVVLAI
jgi:ubiquinone biosynthesis protein Coq4